MSLVGPRPHQPREVEKYTLEERRLLTIKPGLTGMAQVNGREENDFKKETLLDIFYIENWSILLDLKIILKTFSVVIARIKK
jgi:lipopolysaccharide/colanic/teichoic acid biosynthesis glycosyltransferase